MLVLIDMVEFLTMKVFFGGFKRGLFSFSQNNFFEIYIFTILLVLLT